jgi:hypothetical protein
MNRSNRKEVSKTAPVPVGLPVDRSRFAMAGFTAALLTGCIPGSNKGGETSDTAFETDIVHMTLDNTAGTYEMILTDLSTGIIRGSAEPGALDSWDDKVEHGFGFSRVHCAEGTGEKTVIVDVTDGSECLCTTSAAHDISLTCTAGTSRF